MHIIWKRPDGFQNALPEDFRKVALSNGGQLWLHRYELDWYPFQVSGDWAGQVETIRLNRLVNLVDGNEAAWKSYLEHFHDENLPTDGEVSSAAQALVQWIETLKSKTKGNTWEVEIMRCALEDAQKRIRKFL